MSAHVAAGAGVEVEPQPVMMGLLASRLKVIKERKVRTKFRICPPNFIMLMSDAQSVPTKIWKLLLKGMKKNQILFVGNILTCLKMKTNN